MNSKDNAGQTSKKRKWGDLNTEQLDDMIRLLPTN